VHSARSACKEKKCETEAGGSGELPVMEAL
jgi:hypothetical protein